MEGKPVRKNRRKRFNFYEAAKFAAAINGEEYGRVWTIAAIFEPLIMIIDDLRYMIGADQDATLDEVVNLLADHRKSTPAEAVLEIYTALLRYDTFFRLRRPSKTDLINEIAAIGGIRTALEISQIVNAQYQETFDRLLKDGNAAQRHAHEEYLNLVEEYGNLLGFVPERTINVIFLVYDTILINWENKQRDASQR